MRRPGEAVVLTTPEGRQIIVAVAMHEDGKLRLAFDADREVAVDRLEVHDAKGQSATVSQHARDFLAKCGELRTKKQPSTPSEAPK